MTEIELTSVEVGIVNALACQVVIMRQGESEMWQNAIGAVYAYCRFANVYPPTTVEEVIAPLDAVLRSGERVDVRSSKPGGRLMVPAALFDANPDIDLFVLVTGRFPSFNIIGMATLEQVRAAPIRRYRTDVHELPREELADVVPIRSNCNA